MKTIYTRVFIIIIMVLFVSACAETGSDINNGYTPVPSVLPMPSAGENDLTLVYDETLKPPCLSNEGGFYVNGETIITEMTNLNQEGKIYYTLDGTIPWLGAKIYERPLIVLQGQRKSTSLIAVVITDDGRYSDIAGANYTYYAVFNEEALQSAIALYNGVEFNKIKYSSLNDIYEIKIDGNVIEINNNWKATVQGLKEITELNDFFNFNELETLHVKNCSIKTFPDFSLLPKLRKLNLSGNNIVDISELTDKQLFTPRVLDLSYNQIVDASPIGSNFMTNLGELNLAGNPIEKMPNFMKINFLYKINVSDTGLKSVLSLARLRDLTEIDISNNSITELHALSNLGNLRRLHTQNNEITDISPLSYIDYLTYLDISGNKINDYSPLVECGNLMILKLTDDQLKSGSETIKQMTWLKEIITDEN